MKNVKSFDNFVNEGKSAKDYWWDRNYNKLIDVAGDINFEDWKVFLGSEEEAWSMLEQTGKNKALALFNIFNEDELDGLLKDYLEDIDESKEVQDFDRFQLLKDVETDNGKLKKGKKFDSFGGLVCAIDVEVDGKRKSIRFDDKEYFKSVK